MIDELKIDLRIKENIIRVYSVEAYVSTHLDKTKEIAKCLTIYEMVKFKLLTAFLSGQKP